MLSNVLQVLLVITDGNSQSGATRVGKASDLLNEQGVNVFAIGVGNVNYNELRAIATDNNNIFRVGNLAQLTTAVNSVRRASCAGKNALSQKIFFQMSSKLRFI